MRKKILHIVGDSQFGGGAVLILRIAQEAAHHGYDVAVLSTDPRFQQAIREAGLRVVDVDCIWRPIRPLHDVAGFWRLRRYLKQNRYDIVHTHTSKAGLVGRAAAFYAQIPGIVHTVHGFAFHEESSRLAVTVYSWLERLAAKWCNRIVTVSKFHRSWALELGICGPDRIVAIPNGVAPERVAATAERSAFRSELGLAPDQVVLVSAGRLAHQKGIEFLIEAVRILRDGGVSQLRVVLAGDGPMRGFLEQKVKEEDLEREFIFLGFRTDVANVLAAGDIAVMPTEREGMSVALLEAMAAGKPVITTTIGSNLEVTENGKFASLVEPRNVPALAAAIKKVLLEREHFTTMGHAAKQHFFAVYTEKVMLHSYMALYDQLASVPVN